MTEATRIIRVFPRRTSMTPTDPYAFVGDPPLWRPQADEVHVSVTFTWDIERARRLVDAWSQYYPVVKVGGPVFGQSHLSVQFEPGLYVRPGVTFTTRGCDYKCPWCLVPFYEGRLRILPDLQPGHIVQDNNLLQAGPRHVGRVCGMLKAQRQAAVFSGGLMPELVREWVAEELRGLRIKQVFLSADAEGDLPTLRRAARRLSFLGRNRLRCYMLVAYGGETLERARQRLEDVWEAGCMPFAQLYRPPDLEIRYGLEWRALAREWSRPAAMVANHGGEA